MNSRHDDLRGLANIPPVPTGRPGTTTPLEQMQPATPVIPSHPRYDVPETPTSAMYDTDEVLREILGPSTMTSTSTDGTPSSAVDNLQDGGFLADLLAENTMNDVGSSPAWTTSTTWTTLATLSTSSGVASTTSSTSTMLTVL